jgi:hypothetical protein
MDTQPKLPAYEKVRRLIKAIDSDGTLTWHPGGAGGGGVWELRMKGKTAQVKFLSDGINDLDRLYVPEVDNPRTYRDYGSPGRLVDDAFWRLVDLFPR